MKRFRRWLFNVLAGLSMLLGVATAAIWVRSYYRWDFVQWFRGDHELELQSTMGILTLQRTQLLSDAKEFWSAPFWSR